MKVIMFQVFIQRLTFAEKGDFPGEYSRICILYHNSCIFCLDELGFALIPNPGKAKFVGWGPTRLTPGGTFWIKN
jgi:hypothetical protein